MGEVYLAEDLRLRRLLALKILPPEFVSNRERLRRFEQEARTASSLNHPNIITIHEIGQENGTHFIATEFVDGETLRQLMAAHALELMEALDIALQLATALGAAHQAGIIHRDIKPENIMVRPDRLVKVLDFGLVKLTAGYSAKSEEPTLINSDTGVIKGTIAYMSPEQARGLAVDLRSDIWSFGVVLYEMLARRIPFTGESVPDVLISIIQQDPHPLKSHAPEVPDELAWIITKMLCKRRDERYQSISDVEADLRRLKQRLSFEEELARAATYVEARDDIQADEISEVSFVQTSLDEAVAAPSKELHPNNLSEELTRMVGREEEIGAIEEMLRRGEMRLVTLTGIGGTGKTRLAHAVARRMLEEFSDGVFFIDLASHTAAELVASAIAQPLGVKESGAKSLPERLKEFLREKRMLLVLDNFEQVMDAAMLVKELLTSTRWLKVLVTSRVPLHLAAEQEFSIPPLPTPPTQRALSAVELINYESVALFVARAQSTKHAFALTDENAVAVAEICLRLEGLPLAIELAAARIKLLSPQAILDRLENSLKLLTGGARDLPARQQTMSNTISWSYGLLDEDERRLLNHLSVFVGGFTLEVAEKVCGELGNLQIEVIDGLASLVDKNLLVQRERARGEPRFRMLEVIREFVLKPLEESREAEAVRYSHAAYFLALAEEAEPHLRSARAPEWVARLEEEHDNLRAALRWFLGHRAGEAARLSVALRNFWLPSRHLREARGWMKKVLESGNLNVPSTVRFRLLNAMGWSSMSLGDYETARQAYEAGLAVGESAGDKRQIAQAIKGLGAAACGQDDFAAARKFTEEALVFSRESGDQFIVSTALYSLGELALIEGNHVAARQLLEESLAVARQFGHRHGVCCNLVGLGAVAHGEGDYKAARSHFAEALAMGQEFGEKITISYSLDGFAALAARRGDGERAVRLAGKAEALRESIGFAMEPAERRFRHAYIRDLQAVLAEELFTTAYEQGRALKMDEAVALALQED